MRIIHQPMLKTRPAYPWLSYFRLNAMQERQQQSRLLSRLIMAAFFFAIIEGVVFIAEYRTSLNLWVLLPVMVLLVLAYFISLSEHYKTAAAAFISAITYGCYVLAWHNVEIGGAFMLNYLVVTVLLSAVFLSNRITLAIIGVNLLVMVVLAFINPAFTLGMMPIVFFGVVSGFIMVLVHHLSLLEAGRNAELQRTQADYHLLFNTISDGVLVHQDNIIYQVNPALTQMLGYDADELIGRSIMTLIASDYLEMAQQHVAQRSDKPYELVGIHKDGRRIDVEVTARSYTQGGEHFRVVMVRDVTECKQANEQKISLALEQQKVQMMQHLIHDVAHDLRTPLTIVQSGLHLIQRAYERDTTERRLERLAVIEEQINHLGSMVDNLMTFSRLDRLIEKPIMLTLQDINEVCTCCVKEQAEMAFRKQIDLSLEVQDGLPQIMLDADEFRRALRQVLLNALAYTERGGQVVVSTHTDQKHIIISVKDSGTGIDEGDIENIFDTFYRADTARRTETGGMGLGLAITRRIVKAHGGKVQVWSTRGQGSQFYILLPLAAA